MTDKLFTRKAIAELDPKKETVLVIDNVVYDVSKFLDEHPGGHEVLVHLAGKDASEEFDDVGHSVDAKELMRKYAVGELVEEERVHKQRRQVSWEETGADAEPGFLSSWKLPVLLGLVLTVLYSYLLG